MFLVSQNKRTIFTDCAFVEIELYRSISDVVIEGKMLERDRRVLAVYSTEERAEEEFNRLGKAIETDDKIFYFSKEVKRND